MYKLAIAVALWTPLIAQIPQGKLLERSKKPDAVASPLGGTRFPAAKALEFKPQPAMQVQVPAVPANLPAPKQTELHFYVVEPTPCAHIRVVKPSPATDPGMVVGPPAGFPGKMPIVKGVPPCALDAR